MAGVNLGLPDTPSQDAERLAALSQSHGDIQQLINQLTTASPQQIRNVLGYLESPEGDQVRDLRIAVVSDRQRELVGQLLSLRPSLLADLPASQNVYEGASLTNERGAPVWAVTVNGVELAGALGWQRDFAWGYLGAGPMALAEAILTYEHGAAIAARYRSGFYSDVTSTLPQGRERAGRIWSLESQEIDLWLMLSRLIERARQPGDAKVEQPIGSDSRQQ